MSHIHKVQVHFGDTDGAGIVYYPNFYRWMDQASHELFKAKGLALATLTKERNIIVPLVETNCKFKQALFHDDEVEVHAKVVEIRNKVLKIEHRFIRNDVEVATGYEVRVWTSQAGESLKAVSIPEDVRNLLQGK